MINHYYLTNFFITKEILEIIFDIILGKNELIKKVLFCKVVKFTYK